MAESTPGAAGSGAKKPRASRKKPDVAAPVTPEAAMDAGRENTEGGPMTLEGLRAAIEEKVAIAEKDVKKISEANEFIIERIARYQAQLNDKERSRLGDIVTAAHARLKELQDKGKAVTSERAVKPAAETSSANEQMRVLEQRIATIKKAQGTAVGGEHYGGAQAAILAQLEGELAALKPPEESSEARALKAQIKKLEKERDTNAGMVSGSMQEKVLEDYNRRIAELQEKVGAAAGTGAATEAVSQATIEAPTTVAPEGSPTGTAETTTEVAPPTPEVAPARPAPSARELMSIAKIRAALHDASPEALKAAIERAMFTESKAVLETGATREPLIELVKTLGGLEGDQALRGPAIEKLAAAIGVPATAIEGALARQQSALEQRAREEVRKETQAGLKTVIAKGAAYVGLGAVLNRFLPGWGALTAGVRMVETWRQGNLEEKKVQEKLVAFQKQLEEGDLRDPKALASELLRDLAADVASAKREQVDGLRRPTETETANVGVLAEVMRRDTIRYLQERYPNLTEAQRGELARGAKALYAMDHANATLEAKVAAQQPGGFQKLIATLDKVLGSKALRGGETTKERMLTTAVFAAAGAMARELPVIRNILFAYTGFKAGELLAQGITKRAGRYEVTKPVAAAALAGETVERGVLDRARAQLLDSAFRAKNPAEAQQLREAVERHELALVAKAEHAMDFVAERTAAMEATLTQKQQRERERQVIVNGARIAGAVAGAVLGPMAVEWIAKKFQPEQPTAASTEVAPTPEPETDPRMELLSTRQPKDGWVHIRAKQFYGIEHPELSGDQIVAKMEAHKQMLAELREQHGFKYAANPRHWDDRAFPLKYIELGKADAMVNGALAEDGRTTLVSLRGDGALPYDETGTGTLDAKGNLQFYETKAKFGYEGGAPVAGREITTGDIRYLDAGDTAMSEDEFAAWLKEHPGSQLTEVRPGGGAGRWATVEIIGAGDEKTTIRVPVGDRAPSASRGDAAATLAEGGGTGERDFWVETLPNGHVKQGGVEFLTSYTEHERGQFLAQIEHDRGVASELERQLSDWRAKYGSRPGFAAFERAIRISVSDTDARLQNELDVLAGRKADNLPKDYTRIGDVPPPAVARMKLDALDERLGLRTIDERHAADVSKLRRGGAPEI